ncbi:hypothetical protein BJ165DRAFT_1427036 [Panaeolus papilionaceus]|nr:hypothetical protein BJ165DRAFT_1427036 [Panaeolus papilionaceus]
MMCISSSCIIINLLLSYFISFQLLSLNMIAMITTEYTGEFRDNCVLVSGKRQVKAQLSTKQEGGLNGDITMSIDRHLFAGTLDYS